MVSWSHVADISNIIVFNFHHNHFVNLRCHQSCAMRGKLVRIPWIFDSKLTRKISKWVEIWRQSVWTSSIRFSPLSRMIIPVFSIRYWRQGSKLITAPKIRNFTFNHQNWLGKTRMMLVMEVATWFCQNFIEVHACCSFGSTLWVYLGVLSSICIWFCSSFETISRELVSVLWVLFLANGTVRSRIMLLFLIQRTTNMFC